MSNAQSILMQQFCFRVYRSACMFARWLERVGAWRTSEAVYRLIPLKLCRIGYEVWECQHSEDFEAYLRGGAK